MAYITINKNNIFHNLNIITTKTKSKDKIGAVLKDNAYGHGIVEVAKIIKEYGITKAIVSSYNEASKIESFFEYILVLSDTPKTADKKIRCAINSIEQIKDIPKHSLVELKVDSGMHRNGIAYSELENAFKKIDKACLKLEAVFTHHRSADVLSSEWFWQNQNFEKIKQKSKKLAKQYKIKTLKFHSANSASILRQNNFNEDMVRVGIAIYGCIDMPQELFKDTLKPALSLYAKKVSSRKLQNAQRVGYGGSYTIKNEQIVTNYDFGYGDGFLRACSNNYKTPNNEYQIGNISMDSSMFISNKDEILLFNDG